MIALSRIAIPGNVTVSALSGVAPLAVFVDAQSIPGIDPAEIQDAEHRWDFHDPDAGVFSSGLAADRPTGFIACHTYTRPGTYPIDLTVRTADGRIDAATVATVEVLPEPRDGWTTYYVSAVGDDANHGLTRALPFRSVARGLQRLAPGVRVLFRRGDTWQDVRIPGLIATDAAIGSYGDPSLPRPRWRSPLAPANWASMLKIDRSAGLTITGIWFQGNDGHPGITGHAEHYRAISASESSRLLIHDCEFSDCGDGFQFTSTTPGAVIDSCVFRNIFGYAAYAAQPRSIAFTRNDVSGLNGGFHGLRVNGGFYAVMVGNRFAGAIHSFSDFSFREDLAGLVCNDNDCSNGIGFGYSEAIPPKQLSRVLADRNRVRGGTATITCVQRMTIRHCVYDLAMRIERHKTAGVPGSFRAYNNTCTDKFVPIFTDGITLDEFRKAGVSIHDNAVNMLATAPPWSSWPWANGTMADPFHHNVFIDGRLGQTDAFWPVLPSLKASTTVPDLDFEPAPDGPLIGVGSASHVTLDGRGNIRDEWSRSTVGALI